MSKVLKKEYLEKAVQSYNLRTAREEARRCLICHDAPCSKACPAGTDPAKFIRSLKFNNVKGAAETIRKNNPLGGSCAMICPYDQLCQEACSRCGIDKPIEIGRIQTFLVEQEKAFDMRNVEAPDEKRAGKVACIGAGPASLAAASLLAQNGYDVTIFDEQKKAGGMLTYGIIPSRLPQEMVDWDIHLIKELGVTFELGKKVTSIDELKAKGYDAVFVGTGLWGMKKMDLPGMEAKGVHYALDYLKQAKETDGQAVTGNKVIVIGGGDVAMDCAATAKLAGAEKVMIYYRRTIEEAPAEMAEIKYVQEMGVTITTEFAPEEILTKDGNVDFVRFKGRDGESQATVKADTIVFAIGQTAQEMGDLDAEGVFKGGDLVNGGKTVVEAVAEGKEAAAAMMEYLEKKAGVK